MTGKPSLILVFVLTLCAATPGVLAQSSADARRNALFQDMLANPADLDVAFEYARLAAEAGDLEGAISTLERIGSAPTKRRRATLQP